jgi:hypothetical protein
MLLCPLRVKFGRYGELGGPEGPFAVEKEVTRDRRCGRKLQKTTTFEARVLKNHYFSGKFQKTTSSSSNYHKKTMIMQFNYYDATSDRMAHLWADVANN